MVEMEKSTKGVRVKVDILVTPFTLAERARWPEQDTDITTIMAYHEDERAVRNYPSDIDISKEHWVYPLNLNLNVELEL